MQKKAIRAVNALEYNAHTNNYFKSMSILKLYDLFNYQTAIYFHKALHLPDFDTGLNRTLEYQFNIHDHHTRNRNNFNIKRFNIKRSKFNIQHSGTRLFNSLPRALREGMALSKFKSSLKQHYLSKY